DHARTEVCMLASLQIAQAQSADADALESVDCAADRCQHAPHFALARLDQDDPHQSASRSCARQVRTLDARWPIVEDHAGPKLVEMPLAEIGACHPDVILLFDAEPRVCEAEGQLAV